MKGIKKTLIAGVLACATFNNAQAEVSPFSYGLKAGASACPYYGNDAKISGKETQYKPFHSLFVYGNLHGEYAFTDNIGIGLEAGFMRQGVCLTAEAEATGDAPSVSMVSDGISIPLYVCVYPLGREEEGILKVTGGVSAYVPLKTTCKKGNNELSLSDDQKKELSSFDLAGVLGLGYEFSCGFSIEGKYGYGVINKFNTEGDKEQTIFTNENTSVTGLKKLHIHHATLGVGYNFASLFSK